jgi:cell wall-associated NlpC family hydrolase
MSNRWKALLTFVLALSLILPFYPQSADAHLYRGKYTHQQVGNFLVNTSVNYLRVPYKFGASMSEAPRRFDCSSFTKYVFAKAGIYLPRTAANQSKYGVRVPSSQIQKGDLLFFHVPGRSVTVGHVGIYMGNGKMVHTYGDGGVKISYINGYWKDKFLGAKRMF